MAKQMSFDTTGNDNMNDPRYGGGQQAPSQSTAPRRTRTNARGEILPDAKVWMNVGVHVPIMNADGTGTEMTFVSLGLGIPVDTQEPSKVSGSDRWVEMMRVRNLVLDDLKKKGAALAPGATLDLRKTKLALELRHVNEEQAAPAPASNEAMSAALAALSMDDDDSEESTSII